MNRTGYLSPCLGVVKSRILISRRVQDEKSLLLAVQVFLKVVLDEEVINAFMSILS